MAANVVSCWPVLQTPKIVSSQLSPICFWVQMHFSPQRCIPLFIIICKSFATQHSVLAFCYLPNFLILVLLYRSLTQRQCNYSFAFNHISWLMFKQAKASGKMLQWKMHGFTYINHIKSWATCFLRVVVWEDTWLLAGEGLLSGRPCKPHVFSSFVLRTLYHINWNHSFDSLVSFTAYMIP